MKRDKFLTEVMGECYHNRKEIIRKMANGQRVYLVGKPNYECLACGRTAHSLGDIQNPDFSTWEGFGKLWEWAKEQSWWLDFMHFYFGCQRNKYAALFNLAPENFADALYEFLKGKL